MARRQRLTMKLHTPAAAVVMAVSIHNIYRGKPDPRTRVIDAAMELRRSEENISSPRNR